MVFETEGQNNRKWQPRQAELLDPASWEPDEPRQLWPHQERAIEALRQSIIDGYRRPMLQAPTGAGKTSTAATVVRLALEKGKRVCFVVDSLNLIPQTVEAFERDGIRNIGVIQAQHERTDWDQPVQVASVQTLARRRFPKADIVIIDEAHVLHKAHIAWMAEPDFRMVPFIGLSATPWTKGLGRYFNNLIIVATTQELIDQGRLCKFRVFAPGHPDLSGVKTVAGDYHEGQLAEAMNKDALVADIVDTWLKLGEGRPTLCYGVNCAHAKHLQQRFLDAGVPTGYQDAFTEIGERLEIKRKFHSGEYKIVCNIGTLTKGVDWDVRCIILARPTKSEMLFVQIMGRGLRTAEGKQDCLFLDHSNTHNILGFVTDILHDSLDDGKATRKKPSVALPKECPQCAYLRPPRQSKCPNCGYEPAPPKWQGENSEGVLVELTARGKAKNPKGEAGPANHVWIGGRWMHNGQFFAELRQYAREHAYKEGWASMKYKTKLGTWPNAYKHAPERTVSSEVARWVLSENIRWAKRKAADDRHA
jgi:superfamily II DNA or RNA helicase